MYRVCMAMLFLQLALNAQTAKAQLLALDEKQIVDRLLKVDSNFNTIRTKCLCLCRIEYTSSGQGDAPVTLLIDSIFAQESGKKLIRNDIGFGGDAFFPADSNAWQWLRTLRKNGDIVSLEGNHSGGNEEKEKAPTFLKLFDPLCLTTATIGDLVTGKIGQDWFSSKVLGGEILSFESLKNGDIKVFICTSQKRLAGCELVLSKSDGYMPCATKYFINASKTPLKEFVRGRAFSESKVKWRSVQDVWVPSEIVLFRQEADTKIQHTYECKLEWAAQFESSLLFEEAEMRKRWDSIESLHFDLTRK